MIEFYEGTTKTFYHYVDFSDANFKGSSTEFYYQKLRINYYTSNNVRLLFEGAYTQEYIISQEEVIKVWEQKGTPFEQNPPIPSKGNFCDTITFHDYPIDANNYWALGHDGPENYRMNLKIKNQGANTIAGHGLIFIKCDFEIMDNITYTINSPNTACMVISEGKFITGNLSKILIPEQFYFELLKCTIELNGTIFQPFHESSNWNTIRILEPYYVNINNCIFKNALRPIWTNGNKYHPCIITGCTFDSFIECGILIENSKNMLISGNHFWAPTFTDPSSVNDCIFMWESSNSEKDNNDNPNNARIFIIGNDFHNGITHIESVPFGNNLLPIYIKDNIFEQGITNMLLSNTIGTISSNTGIITNPYTNPDYTPINVCLNSASPDFLDNNFSNKYNNFILQSHSCPSLEPYNPESGIYYWKAGFNKLSSTLNQESQWNYSNIYSLNEGNPGYLYTNYGKNEFKNDNRFSNRNHFFGFISTPPNNWIYQTVGNCWFGYNGVTIEPLIDLKLSDDTPVVYNWNEPPFDCHFSDQTIDMIISDLGFGIYDTVLITQLSDTSSGGEDITIYGAGVKNQDLKNYTTAISKFKNIINNYPGSKYFEKCIYNLYECYTLCDTNHNQSWRNIIFNDLKNYLENKILQYDTIETFVNLAFDFFLKCEIMKKEYQFAMNGYAFIAENSPSAIERLMASLNYIDVERLLQGGSGGQQDNKTKLNKFSEGQGPKPIKDILLSSYKKTKEANKQREESDIQNSNDVAKTKSELIKKHSSDKKLESRARENISISGSLTKEERRERIQKDLMLLHKRSDFTEKTVKKNNIEIYKYELSQNYPNPFNPITNIKYQIQKTGLVTLKIYDITGREIKTLVNEIKNPGNYIVTFNGFELASGVYFYRIQSGDFVQVKKMVLIK